MGCFGRLGSAQVDGSNSTTGRASTFASDGGVPEGNVM